MSTDPSTAKNTDYIHRSIGEVLAEIGKENSTPSAPKKNILILGAGIAGLVAAHELIKCGHHVEILEARDRIGGRILSHHFDDGSYNELGAMRVPESHDYVHHYINEMKLKEKLISFENSVSKNFIDIRGKIRTRGDSAELYKSFELSESMREMVEKSSSGGGGAIFGLVTQHTIDSLTKAEEKSLFEGRLNTDYLRYLGSLSLGEYLNRCLPKDARELVGTSTGLSVWWDKSVTMFLRDNMVGTGNGLQTIGGGFSQLPERLAENVGLSKITLNAEVKSINAKPGAENCVEVSYIDATGELIHRNPEYVLCTIPFAVLRSLNVEGISIGKAKAIRNMTYAASTKVLLNCRERFWERDPYNIVGGSSLSDRFQRQTYYPMDHLKPSPQGSEDEPLPQKYHSLYSHSVLESKSLQNDELSKLPGALIGSYTWGRDARRMATLDEDERRKVVVANIERFHPEIGDYVIGSASIAWEQEKYSAGAFAFLRPGQLEDLYEDAIQSENRLHFAGEHCSTDQAWIQGSMISSLRSVLEIVSS